MWAIPGARVTQLPSWREALALDPEIKPTCPRWYVISTTTAKLGAKWRPVFRQKHGESFLRCPGCGSRIVDDKGGAMLSGGLENRQCFCKWTVDRYGKIHRGCGSALFQWTAELRKWPAAKYIKEKLKGFFGYLILDEVHEQKADNTATGTAAGQLISAARKVIALTGTLIGGKADHLRPTLFRLSARSMVYDGFGWEDSMKFTEAYGRVKTTVRTTEDDGGGRANRRSQGTTTTKSKTAEPGVMPTLFGKHLIGNTVFLGLEEVSDALPKFNEFPIGVEMDAETASEYDVIEKTLAAAISEMVRRGDRRLLGAMVQTLLGYPDYPYNRKPVGYYETPPSVAHLSKEARELARTFVTVVIPKNLDESIIRPKEKRLIELIHQEAAEGRQCWVYVQYTGHYDVQDRIEDILERDGFKVASLRSSVSPEKREAWIEKNAAGKHVVVSHPKLVETGLDLFSKRKGGHNFPTIIFYEQGYNLFTMRQASRRAWRIGQKEPCRVYYLYYAGTMQERCMTLMGRKLDASLSIEGKFSSEGLVAMAGTDDEGSMEMALAKSLSEKIGKGEAQRIWLKVGASNPMPVILPIKPEVQYPTEEEIQAMLDFDIDSYMDETA